GLHSGVVEQFHGDAEGFVEVEADPAAAEIVGLAQRATVDDWAGIAERNAVVVPAFGGGLDDFDRLSRGHGWARRNFRRVLLAFHAHFDVGATDVDDEDFRRGGSGRG